MFLQGITILLTASGVGFNWNKHNIMERVEWLPVSLRGGMASKFLHGWKVRQGEQNASWRRIEKRRKKSKMEYFLNSFYSYQEGHGSPKKVFEI